MMFLPQHGALAHLPHHHDLQHGQLSGSHITNAFQITNHKRLLFGPPFSDLKHDRLVFCRNLTLESTFMKSDLIPGVQAMSRGGESLVT